MRRGQRTCRPDSKEDGRAVVTMELNAKRDMTRPDPDNFSFTDTIKADWVALSCISRAKNTNKSPGSSDRI